MGSLRTIDRRRPTRQRIFKLVDMQRMVEFICETVVRSVHCANGSENSWQNVSLASLYI